jgi:hypothetical protein
LSKTVGLLIPVFEQSSPLEVVEGQALAQIECGEGALVEENGKKPRDVGMPPSVLVGCPADLLKER